MKGFIVLCVIATAFAAPQYNYQQGADAPASSGHNGGIGGIGGLGGNGGIGGNGGNGGLGGNNGGLGGNNGGLGGHGGSGGHGLQAPAGPAIWNKQYFIHSAPEDADGEGSNDSSNQLVNKKNLRVVIIKSPENKGLENAALQLAKSASEDKTAIYVLAKQTDLSELQRKLAQLTDANANKPEVHFVKYRTPEEAEHAQRTIQNQYDQLQGPTSISNEGIAPSSSVIGALGQSSGPAYDANAAKNARTQNGYLPPPAFFRRF